MVMLLSRSTLFCVCARLRARKFVGLYIDFIRT